MRVPAIILFYFLFSYAFNYLKSNFQCQSKLLGHRCRHTTGTEEFGVLPIQFRVCIKQGKVRTLYFQSDTTDRGRLQPFFRKIIRKRNLFQTDESTTGNACSRIVIRVVGNTQVRILIAFKRTGHYRDVRHLFITRQHPTVLEIFRSGIQVTIRRTEHRVQADFVTTGVSDKYI